MKKWIILDRDGVINVDSDNYIKSPDEWIPIPGSLEAIARLNQAGFNVIVATNQSAVGRGLIDINTLNLIHQKMRTALNAVHGHIEGIFYCPHTPDDHCSCRKPKPGLLFMIAEKYKISLRNVIAIGDNIIDIQAAKAVGCKPILVRTGKGEKILAQYRGQPELDNVPVYNDLAEAVDSMLIRSGVFVFLREAISNPLTIGAAFPSSTKLGKTIAQQIPIKTDQLVIELGGGTGVITAELLKYGIAPHDLIIIERSPALADYLNKRFPQLQIIKGDARELASMLPDKTQPIAAVVSSLPLRSLPNHIIETIGKQLEQILKPGSLFIQFTYSLFSKPLAPTKKLHFLHSTLVWRNLPPARVDVFKFN